MRLPRTNLTPASIHDREQGTNADDRNSGSSGAQGLERLREMASRLREGKSSDWDEHFFLGPNVRFTRTPERVFIGPDSPSLDAEAANAIESAGRPVAPAGRPESGQPDALPAAEPVAMPPQSVARQPVSVPARPAATVASVARAPQPQAPTQGVTGGEPSDRLQTAMFLTGRMDTPAAASSPAIAPARVRQVPPQQPSPVDAGSRLPATLAQLSDSAFWEALESPEDFLPAPAAPIAAVRPQPVRIQPSTPAVKPAAPTAEPESQPQAVSLYRVVDCGRNSVTAIDDANIHPAAARDGVPEPVLDARPERKLDFPWSRRARQSSEAAPASQHVAPVVAAPDAEAAAPEPQSKPELKPEIRPQAQQGTGIPVAKPFSIEPIGFSRASDGSYEFPPRALLQDPPARPGFVMTQEQLERNAGLLENVLEDFGIRGEIIHVRPGPVVTLYEFEPAPGVKSSRVIGLADDIARSMSALSARVAVVPGRNVIGIELPNVTRETVFFSELIDSQDFSRTGFKLPLCLGKAIGGEPVIAELAKMPHLLVAGTTGSGKSVAINTMILSILYRLTPEECRLIMVDPKMLELSVYDGIPHLLTPVVTDPKKAVLALKWAVREMEERYRKMSRLGVRNIDGYNARAAQARAGGETVTHTVQTGFEKGTGEAIHETRDMDLSPMPYIVVIVDEMADLMMVAGKEIEGAIQRLAQMARAAGIHLIMATQRPSVDVITGTIKANFPTRISFQVTSKIDSRTILGEQGAEQLLGQGDMLHMAGGGRIARVHGPFVSDEEVEKVVSHLKCQGKPDYLDTVTTDEDEEADEEQDTAVFDKTDMGGDDGDLYDKAVKVVLRDKKCSTSYIQRRLGIGYNRAASLVERMEKEGLVGAANHVGKREIISQRDAAGVQEED